MEPSFWFREVQDKQRYPSLAGTVRVDAVIVGGGVAGVSAAYFLSRSGVKTALVEMGDLVTGDSGYTTAFATHFLDSTEATLRAWQASQAGISLFRELIGRERISCDWEEVDGIGFTRKSDSAEFEKDLEAYRTADGRLEYLDGAQASALLGFPVTAAFRKKAEGQFHVRKFLLGLAERARAQGAVIFEASEVVGIEGGQPLVVRTEQGSITADWLIVSTGPPSRQFFPVITARLSGAVTYVLQASYPGPKPFGRSLFWDDLAPYHYFRWVSATDLILGGEDWLLGSKRPAVPPHSALEAWLAEISGGTEFTVANRWQGTIYYTRDVLPLIGPHRAYGQRTIFLTGWAGNGMAHGLLAGHMAADMVTGKGSPYRELFSPDRS